MRKRTKGEPSLFFTTVSRTSLAINKSAAGAGIAALLGFAALFAVATLFFVTENYFIAMLLVSFALLVYVKGAEVSKLVLSSITIFFSSKHVLAEAAYIQETLVPLKEFLRVHHDERGELLVGPIKHGSVVELPNNPLARDIQSILAREKGHEYTEYTAHSYYVECHELYDHTVAHLDFVAGAMPLFGLIGTIVGLIGMFDSLGADVSVEFLTPQLALALKTTLYGAVFASFYNIVGSRFEQRLKALDYDYDTFCRALEVLVENEVRAELTE